MDTRDPPDSTRLWHYMDFTKFVGLLRSSALHLATPLEFPDRYEGDIGRVQKKTLIERHGKDQYEQYLGRFEALKNQTHISCWTENEVESEAMWRIYTGAAFGISLQTTFGRLKSILPESTDDVLIHCARVHYVDYATHELELEPYHLPYFYKRKAFEHEREIRLLVQDRPGGAGRSPTLHARLRRRLELTRAQLHRLIENIYLSPGAPDWFEELVEGVSKDYGLVRKPLRSSLDEVPGDELPSDDLSDADETIPA